MSRRFRRLTQGVAIASITAMAGALGLVAAATPSNATSNFSFTNIAGPDRYSTAADLATAAFPSGASQAIIATAFNFPDALAGNFLAGNEKAPILLVNASGPLPPATVTALSTLKTASVTILGGTLAVGSDVQAELNALTSTASGGGTITSTRIAGAARDDTAQMLNTAAGTTVGTIGGLKTAFLVRDDTFADALAAGVVSYAKNFPIILTPTAGLSTEAQSTISTLGIKQLLIMGGTAAISSATEASAVAAEGTGAAADVRFAGTDRSDTAQQLATYAVKNLGFSNSTIAVASGDQSFGGVDALAAGPYTGTKLYPLLITNSVGDAGQAVTYAKTNAATLSAGISIGGTNPLPAATLATITAAATSVAGGVTTLPQLVSASIEFLPAATGPSTPAGTYVQYVFSKPLTGDTLTFGDFNLYSNSGVKTASTGVSQDGTNADAADAYFGTLLTSTAEAAQTLATVTGPAGNVPAAGAAVQIGTTSANPAGSATVGTSTTTTVAKQTTNGPDLVSVAAGNDPTGSAATAPTNGTNQSILLLTFDKPAWGQLTTGFHAFYKVGTTTGAEEVNCTGPASTDTDPSNAAVIGGNGTTTIAITCPNPSSVVYMTNSTPISDVSRVVIDPGAVATAQAAGINNPLEASPTPHLSGAASVLTPDLASVSIIPGSTTAGTADEVVYTFDRTVTLGPASDFGIITNTGAQETCATAGVAPATALTDCNVAIGVGGVVVMTVGTGGSPAVPTGANAAAFAVGAYVTAGAVTGGLPDELGVTSSATGVTSGSTPNPLLTSAGVVTTTNALGTTYTATYTFDEAVIFTGTNTQLHLYDADGTQLTCMPTATAIAGTTATTATTVTCSSTTAASGFEQIGGSPATAAQMTGAVLATVDGAAATGDPALGAANNLTNAEGGVGVTQTA